MNDIKIKRINRILYYIVIIIFVYILSYSMVNNLVYSQNNQEVKYFKNIDKTHYYIQFVNEIPYFRVNRYNQYYEVIYINDIISEVLLYRNNNLVERMGYSYPEKGKTLIEYYVISNENDEEKLNYYEVFYYDMGLLTKKENYSDKEKLNYYIEIDYHNNKPVKEYYLDLNNTYIYKFYYYEDDIIRYVLRRGIVYDSSNIDKKNIINEKWIYHNKAISSLEKYNGSNISEKYYFNQYGNIIKREVYNELQRIDRYYLYEYNDYTALSVVSSYETNDPYYSLSRKSNIIESYHLSNNEIIRREYLDNIIEKETVINEHLDSVSEMIFYQSGKLKEINYLEIVNKYDIEGYSKSGENIKYIIDAEYPDIIKLSANNEEPSILSLEDENSKFNLNIYNENGLLSNKLVYSPSGNKLFIHEYENDTIVNSNSYFIMDSFNNYLSKLNLNPENHIILFPPDNKL